MSLLDDGATEVAKEAWELLQMLATNPTLYREVLKLDTAKAADSQSVDWTRFFDKSSSYRLLYTLQIVQAVLEDGEQDTKRVILLNSDAFPASKEAQMASRVDDSSTKASSSTVNEVSEPGAPLELKKRGSQVVESAQEDAQLRSQWAEEFVNHGGFQHILSDFMVYAVPTSDSQSSGALDGLFGLKYLAFMLRLLRTFIMAAFSTNDTDAY